MRTVIIGDKSPTQERLSFAVPVTRNFVNDFVIRINDSVALEQHAGHDIRLKDIAELGFTDMLGATCASALLAMCGDNVNDPASLAERIVSVFGYGSRLILEHLLDYASSERMDRLRAKKNTEQEKPGLASV